MAKTVAISLPETRRLGNDLLTSVSNVNNAAVLLSILSSHGKASDASSPSSETANQCCLEALRSLHAFFIPHLRTGKLLAAARSKAKDDIEADNRGGVSAQRGAEAVYQLWVWNKYQDFRKSLFRVVARQGSSQSFKVASITTLMDLVREERPGKFQNALYLKICARMAGSRGQANEILQVLTAKYYKYGDVRYFTYSNVEKLITKQLGRQHPEQKTVSSDEDSNEDNVGNRSHVYVRNVYDVLSSLPAPRDSYKNGDSGDELWASSPSQGGSVDLQSTEEKVDSSIRKLCTRRVHETFHHPFLKKDSASQKSVKRHKHVFSKAWLSFLQLPLPLDTYKKTLASLHQNIIPHMTNPILLSDFLTQSYNSGGLISVMALSSLFILVTKYGLEYPKFYNKLYALLEPSIFVAKYRSRFFELLDTCLSSSHLPGYMGAAFTKRLGRIALAAPPSGSIVVIALIHNLLRRHPSINVLVHQPVSTSVSTASRMPSESNSGTSEEESTQNEGHGADPFVATEPDTAKCNALNSSLWELEALRRHHSPAVSRFVESLETDLTVRAKTSEMAIQDFSSTSYATIFGEEVGRRLKSAPLAFYAAVPDALFPAADREDAFPGWRFEESSGFEESEPGEAKMLMTDRTLEEEKRTNSLAEPLQAADSSGDDTGDSRSRSDESEDAAKWPGSSLKRLRTS